MAILATALTGAQKSAKAIYAAIVAWLTGVISITVGDVTFVEISINQWLVIALAVVVAGGGVFGLTNKTS